MLLNLQLTPETLFAWLNVQFVVVTCLFEFGWVRNFCVNWKGFEFFNSWRTCCVPVRILTRFASWVISAWAVTPAAWTRWRFVARRVTWPPRYFGNKNTVRKSTSGPWVFWCIDCESNLLICKFISCPLFLNCSNHCSSNWRCFYVSFSMFFLVFFQSLELF